MRLRNLASCPKWLAATKDLALACEWSAVVEL
jgi:hypothetical protein